MTSFDALRASHVGAMSYYCKPQPPEELIGCWPVVTGSDKSRYNGNCLTAGVNGQITTSRSGVTLPYSATLFNAGGQATYYLGRSLDLSQDWTFEYLDVRYTKNSYCHCDSQVGSIRAKTFEPGLQDMGVYNGSTLICSMDNGFYTDYNYFHFAMVYRAYLHKMICFINGATKNVYQGNLDLSGSSYINVSSSSLVGDSYAIANVRICQKAIGTTNSFPVPTKLYTGFEPL